MSWCLSSGRAVKCSPGLSQRSVPRTFFAPCRALLRTSVTSPCGVCTRGSVLVSMKVSLEDMVISCQSSVHAQLARRVLSLDPDAAFHTVPDQVFRSAVEYGGHKAVRG